MEAGLTEPARAMMAGMDASLLKHDPARVQVTHRGGRPRWLADPPHARPDEPDRWRLTDDPAEAGVWEWQAALALEREARQPWRGQTARAVAVEERHLVGDAARARAAGMELPDAAAVRCIVFGPDRVLVLRAGGRELLPAIAAVAL